MKAIFFTTLLFVSFQTCINTKRKSTTVSGPIGLTLNEFVYQELEHLANSTHDLEKKYETMKNDIDALRKLHRPCEPCKASSHDKNMCDCTDIKPKKDCLEFFQNGYKINGVYRLKRPGFHTLHAYCDQTTQGGGWTVFQRRQDGSVDFKKKWNDYKNGFGKLEGEFWFGNENIHDLTKSSFAPKKSQLLINMRMKGKLSPEYVKYSTFEITDEATKYVLKINGFSGNVTFNPRGFDYNNNRPFSTIDDDNDGWSGNCASKRGDGGWWYGYCSYVQFNSQYKFTKSNGEIFWYYDRIQPEFVEMKMRRNL